MGNTMTARKKFAYATDLQSPTNDLSASVEQLELIPERKSKPSAPVDKAYLYSLPSLRRAIRYSMSLRDLEPKQVYEQLGKDAAAWSRIENGGISFPADDMAKLIKITGNDAPLQWLAHECGYELRPLKSELQERLEAAEAERAELQRQNDLMRELLTGRR
jgi:hypothetical protein